ncbi:MAG: DUF134 domain-containing protein [Candidatus Lokiarchaeota archaeon]
MNKLLKETAEFEAMRLRHYINLRQIEAAESMNVSQPTFSRILEDAHNKVTQAIMEGKAIRVSGGTVNFKKGFIGYGCLNCDNEWEDSEASKERESKCPKCGSKNIYYLEKQPL